MYVNSSLAKVEAIKGGLRRGDPAGSQRPRERVHGREHLLRARRRHHHAAHLRRRSAGGDHPGLGRDHRPAISVTRCATSHIIRTDLYLADEAFLTGTAAEVVPIRAVDDRPGGHGPSGPDHQRDPADLLRHRARRGRPLQGLAGLCRLTQNRAEREHGTLEHSHGGVRHSHGHGHTPHAHDYDAPRPAGGGRHLRHHLARRQPAGGPLAHRRRQVAGGRAARPPRGHLHRGRLARCQPQGHRVLRPGQEGAGAQHGHPGGLRLDPPGRGERPRTTPSWPTSSMRGRRWPASWPSPGTGTWPRRCAPRSTRPWPWWPIRFGTCAAHDLRVLPRRRALLRRLPRQPRLRPACPGRRRGGGRRSAGPVRHQRRARSPTTSGRPSPPCGHVPARSSASTATTTPAVRSPIRLVAVQAGVTQVQGCINGYGERAGNTDLSAAIPNLSLKLNIRTIPAERLERLTPVAHHIAELVNIAPDPQQPYVGNSVFAHKGGLHASAVARSAGPLRARRAQPGGQRHPGRRLGDGRALDAGHEGGRARARPRRRGHRPGARRAQAARARGLSLRGGRRLPRAAPASGHRLDAPTTSRSSRSG